VFVKILNRMEKQCNFIMYDFSVSSHFGCVDRVNRFFTVLVKTMPLLIYFSEKNPLYLFI